jgi:hypothetical protein
MQPMGSCEGNWGCFITTVTLVWSVLETLDDIVEMLLCCPAGRIQSSGIDPGGYLTRVSMNTASIAAGMPTLQ